MQKSFIHPQIGLIQISSKANARGIRCRVSSDMVRFVVRPSLIGEIEGFTNKNIQWILDKKQDLQKRKSTSKSYLPDIEIDTLRFKIKFQEEQKLKNQFSARLEDGVLLIKYPPAMNFTNTDIQLVIRNIVRQFLIAEAKKFLPQRVKTIAQKYNFEFSEVKITSAKTRWGSCNSKKNINLSCFLMFMPQHIVDYVITHELCHTKQMNHGTKFYTEIKNIYSDYKTYDTELKNISKNIRGLY
ncbi:MAG: M48 family metallopeptidase [Prevotellaceae bacterium]|nr:M48 family metallopeptidase [Prevotellaceae bacterium]